MSAWGVATFGDPCRQCGYRWSITEDEAVATVHDTAADFERVLSDVDGSRRHPDLVWPIVAYVCHVADNLRIWAERLAGLAAGAGRPVAPFDQDDLARARRYDEIALPGALWSLQRAVGDWTDAVDLAQRAGVTLTHPDRGTQSLLDVVRTNAHDTAHHRFDVQRIIDSTDT
jgi:hypothetical protein